MNADDLKFTPEKMQEAIDIAIAEVQKKLDKINSDRTLRYIAAYTLSIVSTAKSMAALRSVELFDTIPALCRDFLEAYAILKDLFSSYTDPTKRDQLLQKLYLDDLTQTVKTYKAIKDDPTAISEADRNKRLDNMVDRMEAVLKRLFPQEYQQIDMSDKATNIPNKIKTLKTSYDTLFPDHNSKTVFIGKALMDNKIVNKTFGHALPYSFVIYPDLCGETHNNVGALEKKFVHDGEVRINVPNHNIDAAISTVYWCLMDIAELWSAV